MSRPSNKTGTPGEPDVAVLVVLGALAMGLVVWLGGEISASLVGHPWPKVPFTDAPALVIGLLQSPGDPSHAWPQAYRGSIPGPAVFYAVAALLLGSCIALVMLALRHFGGARSSSGLARRGDLAGSLSARAVRKRGRQVRPRLSVRRASEVGISLGRDARSRRKLWASFEDSFLVLGPPRSGKGIHFVVPGVLSSPGPAVVTSTRPDVLLHTAGARPGPIHVFDPFSDSGWPQPLSWSPVEGCSDPLRAIQRAAGFATGAGFSSSTTNADYWSGSAAAVIRCYLHAAALAGAGIADVLDWAFRPGHPAPVRVLRSKDAAAPGWAETLANLGSFESETRDSIWSGVQRAFDCFADPRVLAACSPQKDQAFDAESFVSSKGTLYVIGSSRSQLSVAPLISALVEDLTERAHRLAYRCPGGRLDPPLCLWLDEAANIAPLPSLPFLLSAGGGSGICTVVVLQSLAQARQRWGAHQADALWDSSTVRVVLGGLGNADDLAAISRLAGEVDEEVITTSKGGSGPSSSTALRRRAVLAPEELRTLASDRAVVLHRRTPPVKARISPWWKLPCAKAVQGSLTATARICGSGG